MKDLTSAQVCIIDNPAVAQKAFIQEYQLALAGKGYQVRLLPVGSPLSECVVTSTYTANWTWDLALYMVYAEIKVFSNGATVGEAIYDARKGGANMGKFISADEKIRELVDALFPGQAKS